MAKYKVYYSGYALVEADSIEEAADTYDYGSIYEECEVDGVEEVDDFIVDFN